MADLSAPPVLHQALLGRLYDQLIGESEDFEKTGNFFTWMSVGMPIDPSEWDFMSGIVQPPIIETLKIERKKETAPTDGTPESGTTPDTSSGTTIEREFEELEFTEGDAARYAMRTAATFYHLVDSIPETDGWIDPTDTDSIFTKLGEEPDETLHARTLGRSVTHEYARVLRECEIAEVKQSPENVAKIEALSKMLETSTTLRDENGEPVLDPMTNEPMQMTGETRFMKVYNKHKQLAEDAQLRLRAARVDQLTSEDTAVIMKSNQELPILQARFNQAQAMWEGIGMKNQVETWMAEIARLAPQTIASYWQRCSSRLEDALIGE